MHALYPTGADQLGECFPVTSRCVCVIWCNGNIPCVLSLAVPVRHVLTGRIMGLVLWTPQCRAAELSRVVLSFRHRKIRTAPTWRVSGGQEILQSKTRPVDLETAETIRHWECSLHLDQLSQVGQGLSDT